MVDDAAHHPGADIRPRPRTSTPIACAAGGKAGRSARPATASRSGVGTGEASLDPVRQPEEEASLLTAHLEPDRRQPPAREDDGRSDADGSSALISWSETKPAKRWMDHPLLSTSSSNS